MRQQATSRKPASERYAARAERKALLRANEEKAKTEAQIRAEKQKVYQGKHTAIVFRKIQTLPELDGVQSISVDFITETEYFVNFSSWKEPNVSFEYLQLVSNALKTRKINFTSPNSDGGCESCGHGASWTFSLKCSDCDLSE